jgi:hypothetical protein
MLLTPISLTNREVLVGAEAVILHHNSLELACIRITLQADFTWIVPSDVADSGSTCLRVTKYNFLCRALSELR